jgi:hypothetical protein
VVQIFVPISSGLDEAWRLASVVERAFTGKADGIEFKRQTPDVVGRQGNVSQLNVNIDWEIQALS